MRGLHHCRLQVCVCIDHTRPSKNITCFGEMPIAQKNLSCLRVKCYFVLRHHPAARWWSVSRCESLSPLPVDTLPHLAPPLPRLSHSSRLCNTLLPGRRRNEEKRECATVRVGGVRVCRKWRPSPSVSRIHHSRPFSRILCPFIFSQRSRQRRGSLNCLIVCLFQRGCKGAPVKLRARFVSDAACLRSQSSPLKTSRFLYARSGSLNFQPCIRYLKHSGTFVLPENCLLNDVYEKRHLSLGRLIFSTEKFDLYADFVYLWRSHTNQRAWKDSGNHFPGETRSERFSF